MLVDKVEYFMMGFDKLKIEKDCGFAYNTSCSAPIAIRPDTIDKIKKLIYDDLMFTCEETYFGLKQSYMNMTSGKWR